MTSEIETATFRLVTYAPANYATAFGTLHRMTGNHFLISENRIDCVAAKGSENT
jgi:hypothetical protein